MGTSKIKIQLPLHFDQIVDLVKQLPYNEKVKLTEVLKKETGYNNENDDPAMTHLVSEKVLGKEWLLPEEDEAWKDL